ncbi:MAG: porin family protein [Bacteroidales bacterium]|nr:porin family protein [Bacteroidales bacterium]
MKKLLLMILAVLFISLNINAQEDFREQLKFGIKAGINFSNVYDEVGDEFTADGKLGFVGGAFLAIPIGKFLGVQPEILFSQKGFKADGTILGVPYTTKHTSTFIDIPLLITLKPTQGFTILAGPQYSYLMKEKDSFEMNGVTTDDENVYQNDNIRKNILCFIGGIDINLKNLVLGARVGWDLQHNNGDGTSSSPRYKNAWYQATLGIRF